MRHQISFFSLYFARTSSRNGHWESFIWFIVCGNHFCIKSSYERENKKIRCNSSLLFLSIELRGVICVRPRGHRIGKNDVQKKRRKWTSTATTRTNRRTSLSITTLEANNNNIEIQLAYRHNPIELICSITFALSLSFSHFTFFELIATFPLAPLTRTQ